MAWFDSGWGLATLITLPLVGTMVILLSQPKSEDLIKGVAFVTSLSTFMLSVLAARRLSPAPGEEIIIEPFLGGIPGLADRYHITSFGLRLPILVLFGFLATLVAIYSYKQWRRQSHAKTIVMLTLFVLDVLMLELIFEEGSPPPVTSAVLVGLALHRIGRHAHIENSRGLGGPHPPHGRAAGQSDVFEEEMSGLVR